MTPLKIALIAGAALTATGCAPIAERDMSTASATSRSCFYPNQVASYRPDGERRLYARVSRDTYYRFDMATNCNALPHPGASLIVEPVTGSICNAQSVNISVADGGAVERCIVQDMVRLTPEEVAALPAHVRP